MIDPFDYKEPQCPSLRQRGILRRGAPHAQRADYEHYRKA